MKKKQTSAERKAEPVYSGCMSYFPRAMRAISRVSQKGGDKHHPGEPLHWAHEKSTDQPDCVARHMLTAYDIDEDTGEYHLLHAAWRTLAWSEMFLAALEEGTSAEDFAQGKVDFGKLGAAMARRAGRTPQPSRQLSFPFDDQGRMLEEQSSTPLIVSAKRQYG